VGRAGIYFAEEVCGLIFQGWIMGIRSFFIFLLSFFLFEFAVAQLEPADTGFQALACDESCNLIPSDFQATNTEQLSAVIGTMAPGTYEMIVFYETTGTLGVPFSFEINQKEEEEIFLYPSQEVTTEHRKIELEPGLNEILISGGESDLKIEKIELVRSY
jgi:hypothetical protein